jgi:hypothetical protein
MKPTVSRHPIIGRASARIDCSLQIRLEKMPDGLAIF